jgi:hypothetical protein
MTYQEIKDNLIQNLTSASKRFQVILLEHADHAVRLQQAKSQLQTAQNKILVEYGSKPKELGDNAEARSARIDQLCAAELEAVNKLQAVITTLSADKDAASIEYHTQLALVRLFADNETTVRSISV